MGYGDKGYDGYGYGGYDSHRYDRDRGGMHHDEEPIDTSMLREMPKEGQDFRKYYEEMQQKNLNRVQNVDITSNDDGKASFLGVEVSHDMKPLLELALDTARPMMIDFSQRAGKIAANAATRIGMSNSSSKVGLVAENIFRWGVVGSKQIYETVVAGNKYRQERKNLYEKLSPVMHATGANMKNNELVKVAYDDIHSNWIADLKKVAADLPTLIPGVYYAYQDQLISSKRRSGDVGEHKDAKSAFDHHEQQANAWLAESEKIEEAYRAKVNALKQRQKSGGMTEEQFEGQLRVLDEGRQKMYERLDKGEATSAGSAIDELEKKRNTFDRYSYLIFGAASIFSQRIKAGINKGIKDRNSRPRGWKMIEHLKEEIETQCGGKRGHSNEYGDCVDDYRSKAPEDITISGLGHDQSKMMNLKEYLVMLFQQHERDRNPGRDFYNAKTGEAIDPLRGNMLNKLMPLVDVIAENVANGTISPDALYKLVGENKVIKHKADGARIFVTEEELKNTIEKELAPVLGTREKVKREEFMAKFANPALVQETLKRNLESMQGLERSMFASLFPDDILEQTGLKKKEINDIRKQAHEFMFDFVASCVSHLSKQDPKELKKIGATKEEIDAIMGMAERIEQGDVDALKVAVTGHNREVVDAVRTIGMLTQMHDPNHSNQYWRDRVKEMSAVRKDMQEKAAEAKEHSRGREDEDGEREHDEDQPKKRGRKSRSSRDDYDSDRDDPYRSDREDSRKGRDSDSDWGDRYESKKRGSYASEYENEEKDNHSSRFKPGGGYGETVKQRGRYSDSSQEDSTHWER